MKNVNLIMKKLLKHMKLVNYHYKKQKLIIQKWKKHINFINNVVLMYIRFLNATMKKYCC